MMPLEFAFGLLILTFGSYLFGAWIHIKHHADFFGKETGSVINNSRMALLVLAMFSISAILVSSKTGFESKAHDLRIQASKFIYLNQVLNEYGDKSVGVKLAAKEFLEDEIDLISAAQSDLSQKKRAITGGKMKELLESVINLEPQNEIQKDLKQTALNICHDIAISKWLTLEELGSGILWPLVILITIWLVVIFLSFGVISTLTRAEIIYFFALSVCISTAVYLPLELDLPFRGVIHVSHEPLIIALKVFSQH